MEERKETETPPHPSSPTSSSTSIPPSSNPTSNIQSENSNNNSSSSSSSNNNSGTSTQKKATFRPRRSKNKNVFKREREETTEGEGVEEEEEKVGVLSSEQPKKKSVLQYSTKDNTSKLEINVNYESSGTAVPKDIGVTSQNEIDSVHIKKTSMFGPMKASSNIRVTSRFDYQPDICKDYKETGFCGYGDNCKFLHDRGDYKSSWEIEKEWEEKQKNANNPEENYEITAEDEEQYKCFICRDDFQDPIVITKCGHYFCEKCALKRATKTKLCAVCKENTHGSFSIVKNPVF